MMTTYLEVREDMERGLLLSRGSVPTGGLCCGRLHIVIIIIIVLLIIILSLSSCPVANVIILDVFQPKMTILPTCCTNPPQAWTGRRWRPGSRGKEANPGQYDEDVKTKDADE